ncbi:hypothetical protein ACVMB2_002055 [Sinorhizobium meliloti]
MTNVFTADEVVNLGKHQTGGQFHPFTCANRGDGNHRAAYGDLGALIATVRGWICPFCDYTQDWAHGFTKAEAGPAPLTLAQSLEIARSSPPLPQRRIPRSRQLSTRTAVERTVKRRKKPAQTTLKVALKSGTWPPPIRTAHRSGAVGMR